MRKVGFILLTIVIIVVIYIFYPSFINFFIDIHNSKIDYSCNIDSDCEIKLVGRGICDTAKYRCVNKESIGGKLEYRRFPAICEAIEPKPNSCKCDNSVCTSYSCKYEECHSLR